MDEENKGIKKSQEIVITRPLKKEDIERFNSQAPITLIIKNTKGQDPQIIAELNNNVNIRILGGFNEFENSKYATDKYIEKTTYTPKEISSVIEYFQSIENSVDKTWTDLEKATFAYVNLISSIRPDKNEKTRTDDSKPLSQLLSGRSNSFGFSFAYKEILERLGIPCKYFQREGENAWNEVLIDGKYYPVDAYMDSSINEESLSQNQGYELRNFLSDKEFYYMPDHQDTPKRNPEIETIDHSRIQKAIDNMSNPERNKRPEIKLKSPELQKAFKTQTITGDKIEGEVLIEEPGEEEQEETIKIELENSNLSDMVDDLEEIAKYYPEMLSNITLANTTSSHINMQEIVDAIYEARANDTSAKTKPENLVIESNFEEDFNIDFSKAPQVNSANEETVIDDEVRKQKITFRNTSGSTIKLPNLKGKIPDAVNAIELENFDLSDFDISTNTVRTSGGAPSSIRELTLKGGGTSGIADLRGLDDIGYLVIDGITPTEFDDVMNLAASNSTTMPKLFDIVIKNQDLSTRKIFDEKKNQNIISIDLQFTKIKDFTGIENLRDQLYYLRIFQTDASINDIKKVYELARNHKLKRFGIYNSSEVNRQAHNTGGMTLSDETYNYLKSYFERSGFIKYRSLTYNSYTRQDEQKAAMLQDLLRFDMQDVPYFIEDSKLIREHLPYTTNPMMIKDVTTFENYLNDPSNYFEQSHLKDGILWLTKEQLETLISSGKNIPQDIHLKIDTVNDLSNTELTDLQVRCTSAGIEIKGINIFDDRKLDPLHPDLHTFDEKDTQIDTYSIAEYKEIRQELEELTAGITSSMTDVEKFAVIYYRLSKKAYYYDHAIPDPGVSKNHRIYQFAQTDKSRNLANGVRNLEGYDYERDEADHTLARRCVCAGYADLLKNSLALVGVESIIDSGNAQRIPATSTSAEKFTGGHAWNKVKIDGKWCYADPCWDRGEVYDRVRTFNYALKGVNTFVNTGRTSSTPEGRAELGHYTSVTPGSRFEQVEPDDYDQALLKDLFHKIENGNFPRAKEIDIPEDPDFTFTPTIDVERIKEEYKTRKNDMLAKYYGDKDYQARYEEISERYKSHEQEITTAGRTYRTITDYAERQEDEKFLLLENYKESLERMTKYQNGDTSVYTGTPDQIRAKFEADQEYVQTRNHTFDQHKSTQKHLATLGKYGERLPYIPRQATLPQNILRAAGNSLIFVRNAIAPVYRFVGRTIAQPFHRLVTRGKDASPYRNNPYHRYVARRDYFRDMIQEDEARTGRRNILRRMVMPPLQAMANYRRGNEAVLNAGAYDIQNNLKEEETQRLTINFYQTKQRELEAQIATLEAEILANPSAANIDEANRRLLSKEIF